MKHQEFYIKFKANYPPLVNPIFSKRNWWFVVVITVAAVMVEPLLFMSKYHRSATLSLSNYIQLIEYFLFITAPFAGLLFWINWRESSKRRRGYGWVGKFEVVEKQSKFLFFYLQLAPGVSNMLRVSKNLFDKTRIGDLIQIRRDVFGNIEEVNRINNFSSRLTKTKRSSEGSFKF